jgi:3-deoxy-manno-octulosonate cytidylyltransferase (CMP-KDO synthetase)
MKVIGIIPARLESTRLEKKLLLAETGKPLIQHVYERAIQSCELSDLFVATDSNAIAEAVEGFKGKVIQTGPCVSGTDRLAAACLKLDGAMEEVEGVVNIQGDEPEVSVKTIDSLALALKSNRWPMVTVAVWETNLNLIVEPSVVKVVMDRFHQALYFSRAPIPYFSGPGEKGFFRHLGLYAYTKAFLLEFSGNSQTPLEKCEKLEQLRALENGATIKVIVVEESSVGIDTRADYDGFLERYRKGMLT